VPAPGLPLERFRGAAYIELTRARARRTTKRLMGLEPTTFCMASSPTSVVLHRFLPANRHLRRRGDALGIRRDSSRFAGVLSTNRQRGRSSREPSGDSYRPVWIEGTWARHRPDRAWAPGDGRATRRAEERANVAGEAVPSREVPKQTSASPSRARLASLACSVAATVLMRSTSSSRRWRSPSTSSSLMGQTSTPGCCRCCGRRRL
jgi:hypothetical protein